MNIDVSTTTFRLADADVTCQHVSAEHHGCQDEPRRTRIIFVFGTRYPEIVDLATKIQRYAPKKIRRGASGRVTAAEVIRGA